MSTAVGSLSAIPTRHWLTLVAAATWAVSGSNAEAETSPFTKVEYRTTVLVTFDGEPYEWVAIEGTPIERVIASAKDRYGDKWQKRVAEDLPEVLARMGVRVGPTVSLTLRRTSTGETIRVPRAEMTAENRRAVWERRHSALPRKAKESFPAAVRKRWAYYDVRKDEVERELAKLVGLGPDTGREGVALAMQRVIAAGIDGHASVSGWKFPGKRAPFLIEPLRERYVAFLPDRSALLDQERPFVVSLDGRSIDAWIQSASQLTPNGSPQYVRRHGLRALRRLEFLRRGTATPDPGGPVAVSLTDATESNQATRLMELTPRQPMYGVWPRTASRILADGLGYLRITSMDDNAVRDIQEWMPRFSETRGLIVDVRGNGGGSRDALRTLAAYLIAPDEKPIVVNAAKRVLHPDYGPRHLDARYLYAADSERWSPRERLAIDRFAEGFRPVWDPPEDRFGEWCYMVLASGGQTVAHYDRPVVVLMDAKCFSATDIFLAGMKQLPQTTLVGTASGGGSARSVTTAVAGGYEVRLASMVSFQANGELFDGTGVQPDLEVWPEPEFFVGGRDAVLEKAVELF